MNKNRKSGFTLIEVLIVVSIIGLLTAATLIGLGAFRGAGRDTRRLSDLNQIRNAMELYYAKKGSYPAAGANNTVPDGTLTAAGIGVNSVPKDPATNSAYGYSNAGCAKYTYILSATLDEKDATARVYQDSAESDCNINCTAPTYCLGL